MGVFKNHFYHSLIRKYTIGFGALFTDIDVLRYNNTDQEVGRVTCPLSYSPKEKWLTRITTDPNLSRKPAITLPRMAFEMVDLTYDPQRKLPKVNTILGNKAGLTAGSVFNPMPWDFYFNLYITTKTQDDMLQIVEQILPGFAPDYTISMKSITNMDLSFDVPIVLQNVTREDTYDSDVEEGRIMIWTLSFVLKGFLFGPIQTKSLIKKAIVDVNNLDDTAIQYARVSVEPFIDGVPVSDILETDPWVPKVTIEEVFS